LFFEKLFILFIKIDVDTFDKWMFNPTFQFGEGEVANANQL
jgi:hypothetical protein